MSYFVTLSFDLANASRQDYLDAYADLEAMGLHKSLLADNNTKVTLPTTTVAGTYNGASAVGVRDHVLLKVQGAFRARGFSSEIFVTVGGDWTWIQGTT